MQYSENLRIYKHACDLNLKLKKKKLKYKLIPTFKVIASVCVCCVLWKHFEACTASDNKYLEVLVFAI